jgi:frataxin-like iron-binding protein CyaY
MYTVKQTNQGFKVKNLKFTTEYAACRYAEAANVLINMHGPAKSDFLAANILGKEFTYRNDQTWVNLCMIRALKGESK